jgi:hypothetical protein
MRLGNPLAGAREIKRPFKGCFWTPKKLYCLGTVSAVARRDDIAWAAHDLLLSVRRFTTSAPWLWARVWRGCRV